MIDMIPNARVFLSGFAPQKWSRRISPYLLASLLLHGLLLHFGHNILNTNHSPNSAPARTLYMTMRPPITAAPSASSSHGINAHRQVGTNSSDANQPRKESPSHSIDIEAAYAIARQSGRSSRNPGEQAATPAPPTLENQTALGRDIGRSTRPDCRTAHANLGLFAIPFLIADTLSERGCKW